MHHFKITEEIKNLDLTKIKNRLFHYTYNVKNIRKVFQKKEPEDSQLYISTYTSFKGEIFENIVYENLMHFALNEPSIKQFILKGPYKRHDNTFYKSGLMLDISSQIVYKSAYKDISEFDALFFTDDSVYFVEMSTSKKTDSLIKRLHKKSALLKMLFPNFTIRALIVLTEGTKGLSKFPSYCTVWVTKDFDNDEFVKQIAFDKREKKVLNSFKNRFEKIQKAKSSRGFNIYK